ncbi:hypothetical protein KR222_001455 [Zaprionus bogoriensis]|nr:hypothetical protein KR222_001455 [Zaprionus bogoriensis]
MATARRVENARANAIAESVLPNQMDDQPLATVTEEAGEAEQEQEQAQAQTAHSPEQLEFLKFLKSLDDVPRGIGSESHDGDSTAIVALQCSTRSRVTPALEQLPAAELDVEPVTFTLQLQLPLPESEPDQETELEATADVQYILELEPESSCKYFLPEKLLQQHQAQPHALLRHHFLHKLYLAAGSGRVPFIQWSGEQAQQLQLDYIGLQEHLCGAHSMFRCLNVLQFTRHLHTLGFERISQTAALLPTGELRPQILFRHEHFQCNQPEKLLMLLQLHAATPETPKPTPPPAQPEQSKPKRTKASTDPASSSSSSSSAKAHTSPLHLARCRFQTLLCYQNDVRLLQLQEPNVEQLMPRRGRTGSCRQPTQSLTPALAAKHVNPRDSVLHFGAGKIPEYAGFYGRVEQALIGEFFAEYLPRYGSRTIGYKDIVVDASKANAFQQNLPIGMVYSEDEDDLQEQDQLVETRKGEDSPTPDNCQSIPGDMELEQVMQELCGVVPDDQEEDEHEQQQQPPPPQQRQSPSPKPKQKRKKPPRESTETATETVELKADSPQLDPEKDLLQAAAAAAEHVKDDAKPKDRDRASSKAKSSNDQEQDDDVKCATASKGVVKRRRYDLRNSKSKRAR